MLLAAVNLLRELSPAFFPPETMDAVSEHSILTGAAGEGTALARPHKETGKSRSSVSFLLLKMLGCQPSLKTCRHFTMILRRTLNSFKNPFIFGFQE